MDCIKSLFLTVVTAIAVMTSQHAGEKRYVGLVVGSCDAAELYKRHGRHDKCDWLLEVLINGNIIYCARNCVEINQNAKSRMN